MTDEPPTREQRCGACNGSGQTPLGNRCLTCGGDGVRTVELTPDDEQAGNEGDD